jgi:hypothetical protein
VRVQSRSWILVVGSVLALMPGHGQAQSNFPDGAKFVRQTVAGSMVAGREYGVSVTVMNTGNTTWSAAGNFRLGSQSPTDNLTWGKGRIDLGPNETIESSDTKTFTFKVKAPRKPGTYDFQWRMVHESIRWFGETTPKVTVKVSGAQSRN